jgi:uncharacterized membrane protein
MSTWQRNLTIVAAVGSGVMAGLYFTFSTFIMPGLRRLPADRGIAAMQMFNRSAPAPFVLVGVLLTGGACGVTAIAALADLGDAWANWRLAGAVLYAATLLITFGYHIPRNNTLDRLDAGTPAPAQFWQSFVPAWSAGNHLRFALAAAASAALVCSLAFDAA